MEKRKLIFIITLLFAFSLCGFFVLSADIDITPPKDAKPLGAELGKGENISLILGPGSPFAIKLYKGAIVNFDMDGLTNKIIFENVDYTSKIKYTLDGGKTFKTQKIKLGENVQWPVTTGSLYVTLEYRIFNEKKGLGTFIIGIPNLIRNNIDVNVDANMTASNEQNGEKSNNYIKYLIGIIIVLALILIILGPKKKEEQEQPKLETTEHKEEGENFEEPKEEKETKKAPAKKTVKKKNPKYKKQAVNKTNYYTKPKKKSFDEEEVYVVKSDGEE